MKTKSKIAALVTAVLMLFTQVPFTAFAAETTSTMTPDTLENGVEDIFRYQDFFYKGSADIKKVEIIDGSLPDGLKVGYVSLTAFDIRGTPTKAGEYHFTIKITDKKGEELTKDYTWVIDSDLPLEFLTEELPHGYYGTEYTTDVYLTNSRTTKNTWELKAVDGETLPDNLTIGESNGEISWSNPEVGKYNLEVTVTRKGKTLSKKFLLVIEPEGGCTHTNAIKKYGKNATCKENGTCDYWYCEDCEKNFYDANCENSIWKDPSELYTTAFHSDKSGDGKCDTCGKTMPIFKKVNNEDEITSCGMYLVVSKIGDKYYTFKCPEGDYVDSIEALEITQNADGTFSYPEADTGVMILKTEFAAECGELDAGLPRYSFGTVINNIPYGFQSSGGGIMLYAYENSKYGYRINLTDEKYAEIASVYSEYWSEGGYDGKYIFSAVTEEAGDVSTDVSFCLTSPDTDRFPIELYKLTYVGTVGTTNYTLSDTQCIVEIGSEVTVIDSAESKESSTVGGISEAVKTNYVESFISDQGEITGAVSVTTYADINLKSGEGEEGSTDISSLVYEVTPKIEVKDADSKTICTTTIPDDKLDGSEITLTLCVGNMSPAQIIHYKNNNEKEYFYDERSKALKSGQKTFSMDYGNGKGNFVTFTVNSFSEIEILATAKEEPITTGNATITAPVGGQTPSFTAVSGDPSRYSVELLSWIDVENNMDIYPTDLTNMNSDYYNYKFKAGKKYRAKVRFTALGDYELSYSDSFTINGEETTYVGDGLKRTYTFTAETPSTTTAVNGNVFTVTGKHIDEYTVILALYKKDGQNNKLVECKIAKYNGEPIQFNVTATDYSSAKVMVWNNLTNIKPVTAVEIVDLEK